MRTDKKHPQKADKNTPSRVQKRGIVGYSKKSALLEEAITHMNAGKYGQSSAALKDLLSLDPHNTEARRLFATLHLRLGSLATARQAFESLTNEAIERQDFWLAESLLREYLAAGPRCVPFLELLAHVYEEKGDALAAVAELGKAIGILIEGPDSENPKKPSQLYAKVRELAPASSEAFQFASLFDIQTGELLVPHPLAPAAGTSLEIDASQPQDKILPSTEESRASDVMPWEQFGGAPLLGSGSVLDPSATTQPESVSDHLASPAPAPDLTEPSDSILAEGPSTSPAVLPEPEVPSPSAADSSSTVPFSWNTVFDGALKFATGTLSSSSPAAVSKPDATSQDAKDLESVQQESVPDSELSAPSIPSTPEPPVSFSDPEPLPSAHPSILSEVGELIAETDTIREPDLPQPTEILLSEEPLRPEEPPTLSSAIPNSFTVDLPVPPLSEPVEPARESEPVSFPSLMEPQPVAPLLEVSAPESSCSTVISEAPPAPEPVSTEHHETPITLHQTAEAPPLSAASSNAPSASPASMDTLSHRSTGEVGVQSHRPSEKKRKWDKKKGNAPVVPPTPLPLVEEPSDVVAELSRSGGWESAPSESLAPVVEAVAHVVEKDVLREDTRPEWVRASESITFVNPSPSSSATWQDPGIESTHSKPEPAPSVAASAVDVLFDSTGAKSQVRTQDRLASRRPRPRFAARVARVRIGISSFIGSCFSTTRSIALLCLGLAFFGVALVAVGIGAVGLVWMAMEASPSPVYHNLTPSPPQALTDSRKNGYFLLLGFDASAEQDPLQAGYARKVDGSALQVASACMLGDERKETTTGAPDNVIRGWFTSADPVAQLK
ncbi:MAG TPA: tetratricopeptide repeat protein, partial [Nitrospiraceae bacterium]|nr:tetratricopeptide repeat protein [Nitrospiraceae bacterium]